jgi:uncharacterized membrane protein YqjE
VVTTSSRSGPEHDARSTGELVSQLSEQVSRLVRDELRLARLELTEKGKRAGIGAGLLGGAGVVALYGGAALLAAVIAALALAMPVWVAALIVGAALMALAGVLGLRGRQQVSTAAPPVPEEAIRSVQADVQETTERARR